MSNQPSGMRVAVMAVTLVAVVAAASPRDAAHRYLGPPSAPKMTRSGDFSNDLPVAGEDKAFWLREMQKELQDQLETEKIIKKAKNVIFFLADGTGVSTWTAARILKGQRTKKYEREIMSYENFPFSAIIKTYNTNQQTTDSAASATAYLTGVKGNQQTIGVDANVREKNCTTMSNEEFFTTSILRNFQDAGKATGVVTSTRVTHASPAGCYAHTAFRDWESDQDIALDGEDPDTCADIAKQLVTWRTGSNIDVIMGGGRREFLPNNTIDPEYPELTGHRLDGQDLTKTWKDGHPNGAYVWSKEDLMAVNPATTDSVLGLFDSSHMSYAIEEDETNPSLEEMTRKALQILQKNDTGYFLFVEGGLIDYGHHSNLPHYALEEALEFEKAIALAVSMTSDQETLIIVTSDHSQPITINGYTPRGHDILGVGATSDIDGKPFTTLLYTNGPGYRNVTDGVLRHVPTQEEVEDITYVADATVPNEYSNHNGEDIVLYARGPQAHIFTGVHENSYIPHALRYAACVGEDNDLKFCDNSDGGAGGLSVSVSLLLACTGASRLFW